MAGYNNVIPDGVIRVIMVLVADYNNATPDGVVRLITVLVAGSIMPLLMGLFG